jgi:anti-sigma factor RsiW
MTHHHFSDEQLSARLDGEDDDDTTAASGGPQGVDAQIAACDQCRARFAALGQARDRLRRPVVRVGGAAKTAAVAAAMADGLDAGSAVASAVPSGPPPSVRRHSRLVGAAAAAVAVLVVAAAVSVAVSHSHSSSPTAASLSTIAHGSKKSASRLPSSSASPEAAGQSALPDLGGVASPTALKARLVPALTGKYGTATGSPNEDDQSARGSSATTSNGPAVPAADSTCVAVAEQVVGNFGVPTLVATVTYRGIPALVVVSPIAGSDTVSATGQNVVVITPSNCRVLIRTTL